MGGSPAGAFTVSVAAIEQSLQIEWEGVIGAAHDHAEAMGIATG
jgi:hypothetical protein